MNIEEEFFKCFGIEKLPLDCDKCGAMRFELGQCADTDCKRVYPPITSDILLELICIYNNYANVNGGYPIMLLGLNVNALKESLLARCINYKNEFKHQVQSLFKRV